MLAFISKVSEEVATKIAENCHFRPLVEKGASNDSRVVDNDNFRLFRWLLLRKLEIRASIIIWQ